MGTRLNKCVCEGPHNWRCALAIMHDRALAFIYRYRWGAWFFLMRRWQQAAMERDQYKRKLRALGHKI